MKSLGMGMVLGALIAVCVLFLMGARGTDVPTNLERKIYEQVAERWGQLILTGDSNGDFVVINKETATARRVQYEPVTRGSYTVEYGSYCGDSVGFAVPYER